jgi:DUF438 domain-containing protein
MSELINNSEKRKELLKRMILRLHAGESPDEARKELISLLKGIPYGEVVEVEQELIGEGTLTEQEVLKFCDIHTLALEGHIDLSAMKIVPPGHPVDTFKKENRELEKVVEQLEKKYRKASELTDIKGVANTEVANFFLEIKSLFNSLSDVEKHYQRKENLLFPYLEKYGITGPPTVMWGKHDEIREWLKAATEVLDARDEISPEEAGTVIDLVLRPASNAIMDMIGKEEQILLPMSTDRLTEAEWYDIYRQTMEYGFCLYDPDVEWKPDIEDEIKEDENDRDIVRLDSGSFTRSELNAILNALPVDLTFVDKDEKVKYFNQAADRIFPRSRAILNRDVKMCHPPSSVGIVEQILNDFRSGRESNAPFWIQMKGKFIHIEYFALHDPEGNFLGTLEVSQDLTEKRALQGDQRILSYKKE